MDINVYENVIQLLCNILPTDMSTAKDVLDRKFVVII